MIVDLARDVHFVVVPFPKKNWWKSIGKEDRRLQYIECRPINTWGIMVFILWCLTGGFAALPKIFYISFPTPNTQSESGPSGRFRFRLWTNNTSRMSHQESKQKIEKLGCPTIENNQRKTQDSVIHDPFKQPKHHWYHITVEDFFSNS